MVEPITSTVLTISWYKVLINTSLAILGGIVRLLAKKDKQGNVIKPTLWTFIGGVVCSMFTGLLVYLICENYNLSAELTAALTGCGGYIGPVLIDISFAKLQKYVDKKIETLK